MRCFCKVPDNEKDHGVFWERKEDRMSETQGEMRGGEVGMD